MFPLTDVGVVGPLADGGVVLHGGVAAVRYEALWAAQEPPTLPIAVAVVIKVSCLEVVT